jgi:hypothetical protein
MGPLSFDCLDSRSDDVFAKALVPDAVQLAHLKSIKGRYPIVSLDGLSQLGALDVSLSLMDCFSEETSHHGLNEVIVRRPPATASPARIHPSIDTAVSRTAASSPLHLTERNESLDLRASKSNQQDTLTSDRQPMDGDLGNATKTVEHSRDLLSAVIERGQKLRDNMVLFSVSHTQSKHVSDNFRLPAVPLLSNGSSACENNDTVELGAELNAEMLVAKRDMEQRHRLHHLENIVLDVDQDFVLSDGSVGSGIRDGDISDPDDPLHDESLLEDLLYPATQAKDGEEAVMLYATSSDIQLSDNQSSSEDEQLSSRYKQLPSGDKKNQLILPENRIPNVLLLSAQSDKPSPPTTEIASCPLTAIDNNLTSGYSERDPSVPSVHHSVDKFGPGGSQADSWDAELLMLLGRVDVARVKLDTLTLSKSNLFEEKTTKGKKQRRFYIEYKIPVAALSSSSQDSLPSVATEVMRVASRRVVDGVVTFNHHSVFPVLFNAATISQWTQLITVFTVYCQLNDGGKPVRIGLAHFPMRDLINTDWFAVSCQLPVMRNDKVKEEREDKRTVVGHLGLQIELASRNKQWQMANTTTWETRLASKALVHQQHQLSTPDKDIEPGIAGTIAKTESSAATVDDNGVLGIAESSSGIGACQPSFAD